MPAELDFRPGDRVLFLHIPDMAMIGQIAGRIGGGVVVALGEREAVQDARRAARELYNVMFTPAAADEIPFQDGFFSRVVDMRGNWPDPAASAVEVLRVLAPGGEALLCEAEARLLAAALPVAGEFEGFVILRKPEQARGEDSRQPFSIL